MRDDPILDAFDLLARRDPNTPLVASLGAAASRGDVEAWSRAAGASLAACGAPRGAYVLLAAVNGAGFLAALLGARRAGLIPVLADWASPPAERARVAAGLGVAARIECGDAFPDSSASFRVERGETRPAEAPGGAGYVKLTSGSSGLPSGVAIAAEALAA